MSNAEQHRVPATPGAKGRRWDLAIVGAAALAALALGFADLARPSLWHDELVHVYVANSILETGRAALPSGHPYASAPLYNMILAGAIALFGDGEAAVRAPSVVLAACNVLLAYVVFRPLLGRGVAVVTAVALGLSPWSVAWSRQARFYVLQQGAYLAMVGVSWRLLTETRGRRIGWAVAGVIAAYAAGLATSLHSVLFLAPLGAYAGCMVLGERRVRTRFGLVCVAVALVGMGTMAGYYLMLPKADSDAIFEAAGIGSRLVDSPRATRLYYLRWLWQNLSLGFFVLALGGFAGMVWREKRRGLFTALAFWAPVFALSYLVAYRRPRFMYFTFPFYVAAFSYALVRVARFLTTVRQSRLRMGVAVVLLVFLARVALSAVYLTGDTLSTARGDSVTLARRHPQWRAPCRYVRERLADDVAVIATTYVPVLYYVGRIDDWYPSEHFPQEVWETGSEGIRNVAELEAFVADHPKGYYLAEWWRLNADVFPQLAADRAWVLEHMTRIDAASSDDVTVYAWGMTPGP